MNATQKTWNKQHNALATMIEESGAVFTDEDGDQWVTPGIVSDETLRRFNQLTQVGYANGWM